MPQYTDISGIQFNSVNVNVLPRTKSIGNKDIVDATSEDLVDIAAENGGKLPSKVNAVEIDWNAANLGSYIINTTGQLLSN